MPLRYRPRPLLLFVPAAVGCALAVGACSDESGADPIDRGSAVVEYRFKDSSVPPEYHRSYTLTVAAGDAHLVVDSYGDVLHDESASVDEQAWAQVIDRIEALDAPGGGGPDDCTGGTSRDLRVTDADHDDRPAVAVSVSVCGGEGEAAAAAVDEAVQPVLDGFDMDTLLATD